MPREHPAPPPFEPEALERSLDRYLTAGLAFMLILIVGFVIYKVREPSLRADAKSEQQTSYVAIGTKLYEDNCSSCHGHGGNGGSAPVLNAKQFLKGATDTQISSIIKVGVPGSDMQAKGLDYGGPFTDEQIGQITAYLRSLEPNAPSVPDWRRGKSASSDASSSTTAAPTTTAAPNTATTAPSGPVVNVELGDSNGTSGPMTLKVSSQTAPAGKVTFTVKNTGTVDHEMVALKLAAGQTYDGLTVGSDDKVSEDSSVGETGDPALKPGETRTVTLDMPAGSYALVCNIAKHYGMGMRAPFTVTP